MRPCRPVPTNEIARLRMAVHAVSFAKERGELRPTFDDCASLLIACLRAGLVSDAVQVSFWLGELQ